MKNTKKLYTRLYTVTLYSNLIVPLRRSSYIQPYGDFKKRLGFFSKQTRRLVWQARINEVGQKLYRNWAAFETNRLDQKLTETWLGTLAELFFNSSPKMSSDVVKCHQNFIGLSSTNYHQSTTEIPPEMITERVQMSVDECSFQPKEIGSIRVKSGQLSWAKLGKIGQQIGADRGESVRILTDSGTKMSAYECKCGQKIGTNRDTSGRKTRVKCYQMRPNATEKQGDQRRLKATKNNPLTYQRLILLNSSFMLCC